MFSIQMAREHQKHTLEAKSQVYLLSDKKKTKQWLEMGKVVMVSSLRTEATPTPHTPAGIPKQSRKCQNFKQVLKVKNTKWISSQR